MSAESPASTALAWELRLAASPEQVFEALTRAEDLARWFCHHAEVEAGAGGRIVMRWDRPGAIPYQGRWVAFDRPWRCAHEGGNAGYPDGYSGRVSFRLEEVGGGTRLSILHELPARPEYAPFVGRYRDAWPRAIARLERLFAPRA